jgi:hypothetical protein
MFYEDSRIRRPISGVESTLTEEFTWKKDIESVKSGVASEHVHSTDIERRTAVAVIKRARYIFIFALSDSKSPKFTVLV